MRKLLLFIASSLDNYIARPDGSVDWLFMDGNDYGYTPFYESIDTTLMGNKTYEQILGFGDFPYPGKRNIVFTRSEDRKDTEHVEFVHQDMLGFVRQLKQKEGKNIWLIGGTGINFPIMEAGLVDEMIIGVHPIILGSGIPLFPSGLPEIPLHLEGVEQYASGLVSLHYSTKEKNHD